MKTGVTIQISAKINFIRKNNIENKEGHYTMASDNLQGIHDNLCIHLKQSFKYIKQK
jgi:hypothetical protein